jgi:hypothetical protein
MEKHTTLLLAVAIALGLLLVHSQAKEVRLDNKEIIAEWCNYEYKKEVSLSRRDPEETVEMAFSKSGSMPSKAGSTVVPILL